MSSTTAVLGGIAIALIGAVAALALARWRPRTALAASLGCLAVASAWVANTALHALLSGASELPRGLAWELPLGTVSVGLDALAAWFLLALGLLGTSVAIYAWGYFHAEADHPTVAVHAALLCGLVAAMMLLFVAADAVLFLVAWELMALAGFLLVIFHHRQEDVRRAGWVYLVATHLGTALGVVPLMAILIARATGNAGAPHTAFVDLAHAAALLPRPWVVAVFVLGVVGFGTKSGFMPFHVWLPHAHPAAPSPVSALLSGMMIKTGIYGLLRLIGWLPPLPVAAGVALILLAAASGILGVLYAIGQQQLKRLLAYSSIENIGIIGLGIGIGMLGRSLNQPAVAALGFGGALLHVLNHALFKGLLFLSAGAVVHATGTGDVERLGGLARRTPWNAAMFAVGALAICALPPLNGFLGEWLIYNGLFTGAMSRGTTTSAWAAVFGIVALALIGGLALACFARAIGVVFLGSPRDQTIVPHRTPASMRVGMGVLAACCAIVGLSAPWLGGVVARASATLVPTSAPTAASQALVPLAGMLPVAGLFILLAAGLLALKLRLPGRAATTQGRPTWGCGYPFASARVQYTASSFGWSLLQLFKQILPTRRTLHNPHGCFPAPGELRTATPDAAEQCAYEPLFQWVARTFQRLWPLQHGRIQLYLVYIVATLLVVFFVEATWAPHATTVREVEAPPLALGATGSLLPVPSAQSTGRQAASDTPIGSLRSVGPASRRQGSWSLTAPQDDNDVTSVRSEQAESEARP